MTIVPGRVVNGRIEVEDLQLPEGTAVEVYIPRDGKAYDLTSEEEAEIEAACEEADRGGGVPAEDFLRELREKYGQR